MKFLALILSLYIFALNVAPCEDNAIDSEAKTEISQAMDNDHRHQGNDLCSPFCICQCCHINSTPFEIVDFTITPKLISTEVFYHFNGFAKDFSATLLQPPQV
ncbi:MAG: DUF6660 family protein [Flavobacteriaceae bacterium]